jgi:N-carbamoyl-L-amino-acid hydrolase
MLHIERLHTEPREVTRFRFGRMWAQLAEIGFRGSDQGFFRFSWTDEDRLLRDWFREQARERAMTVEQDRNGNLWAWWGEPAADAVVTGSHLDSVPGGGAYDGPLGVVSGFLAVDEMRSRGIEPVRPIAVVDFMDEEGARFGVACLGSKLMSGALAPHAARALTDAAGITLAEAMRAAGADPDAIGKDAVALSRIGAMVELHVEQGRNLAGLDAAVGIASAIWPHGVWRFTFVGESDHAGTTRLEDRADPAPPFAATVLAARTAAWDNGTRATFGKFTVAPGGSNVIATTVTAWLDARGESDAAVERTVAEISAAARGAAAEHGVRLEITRTSYAPEVNFDPDLRDLHAKLGADAGITMPELPTQAGHDAGVLAGSVRTSMLFVRSPSGISHSPKEFADPDDVLDGVAALRRALEALSTAP